MENARACSELKMETLILAIFGVILLCKLFDRICYGIKWFVKAYSPTIYRPYTYLQRYGEWAAITGCTSGIGLALAKELARRGLNLVLISRNREKLNNLAKEIRDECDVDITIIVYDAADRRSTNEMAKQLAELNIGILVNNVGTFFTDLKGIEDLKVIDIYEMMTVNVGNAVITMNHILPGMIKSRKGLVINVCSAGSYFPLPLQSLYGGTKVYLDVITKAVKQELISTGVDVQSICPILVQSNMTQGTSSLVHNFISVSADRYARSVVNKLGCNDRLSGYWFFDLIIGIYFLLPSGPEFLYLMYYSFFCIKVMK